MLLERSTLSKFSQQPIKFLENIKTLVIIVIVLLFYSRGGIRLLKCRGLLFGTHRRFARLGSKQEAAAAELHF